MQRECWKQLIDFDPTRLDAPREPRESAERQQNKRSRSYEGNVFEIKKGEKEEPMDTSETEEDKKKGS